MMHEVIKHLCQDDKDGMEPCLIKTPKGTFLKSWKRKPYKLMTEDEFSYWWSLEQSLRRIPDGSVSRYEAMEVFKEELPSLGIYPPKDDLREKIQRAKEVPMEHILATFDIPIRRGLYSCPLHDDGSPSFKVYKKTNSFYCFGCQSGGDTIDFIQKKLGCDFKTAVERLAI